MASVLTTAGATHITERETLAPLTNAFDAFEFGRGNDTPTAADNRASLNSKVTDSLVQLAAGYPRKNDDDARNEGRASDVWTWRCDVPEGVDLIASNFIVTNWVGGVPLGTEPVLVHSDTVISKRSDQLALVYVNVSTAGAVTVVSHVEDGTLLPAQVATWRTQSLLMSGQSGAQATVGSKLTSRANENEPVWTAARLLDTEGGTLVQADVSAVLLRVQRRSSENDWVPFSEHFLEVRAVCPESPVRTDRRWLPSAGYTFQHTYMPPATFGSRRARLEYELILRDSSVRRLVHEVEFSGVR